MRRTSSVLVLRAASLLANALLIVRLVRKDESEAAALRPPRDAATPASRTDADASLRNQLEAERKKNEELRLRVDQLEADRKAAAPEPVAATAKPDKVAAFREKLRKLMKVMKD